MISEIITKEGQFLVEFDKFNGSGWANPVEKIIREVIRPEAIEKRGIEVSWDYSEYEFDLEKDGIEFLFHIDDEGSRYLLLKSDSSNENKQKLRDWATIIAEEVEKLKK